MTRSCCSEGGGFFAREPSWPGSARWARDRRSQLSRRSQHERVESHPPHPFPGGVSNDPGTLVRPMANSPTGRLCLGPGLVSSAAHPRSMPQRPSGSWPFPVSRPRKARALSSWRSMALIGRGGCVLLWSQNMVGGHSARARRGASCMTGPRVRKCCATRVPLDRNAAAWRRCEASGHRRQMNECLRSGTSGLHSLPSL